MIERIISKVRIWLGVDDPPQPYYFPSIEDMERRAAIEAMHLLSAAGFDKSDPRWDMLVERALPTKPEVTE